MSDADGFDAIHRRKRTRPQSTSKRVTPQERDLLWLQKIHEHGPLATSFLHGFSRHLRSSEKRAKERLTDLFNEDNTPHGGPYLARPHQQFRTLDSRYNELVYDLTPAAIAALKDNGIWSNFATSHTGPWVHRFMVASITASIELATLVRDDVAYIPQSAILARAGAQLRYPTTIIDPATDKPVTKDLMPDALFGLEYQSTGKRSYRFFVLEADRGTEPTTSHNFARKSHLRNVLQYHAYIGGGAYKQHLNLTAPLLLLTVSSDEAKLRKMMRVTADTTGDSGDAYMLFQHAPVFGPVFKPPKPSTEFLSGEWWRAGLSPFLIDRVHNND